MILVSKSDAAVIKQSTVLSAYVVSGAIKPIPVVISDLQHDLELLGKLSTSELIEESKQLVTKTIQYAQAPSDSALTQAKAQLEVVADLLIQTREK